MGEGQIGRTHTPLLGVQGLPKTWQQISRRKKESSVHTVVTVILHIFVA